MQQPPPMMTTMFPAPFPNTKITTEQIQKCLDENKKLILAILDNQNLGKLPECAHFQARLQQNLMYLAAIADAQPQAVAVPPQVPPHAVMQPGGHYTQHSQVGAQLPVFAEKVPLQFNPQQMQEQLHQQLLQQPQHTLQHQNPHPLQGHMGLRPATSINLQALHQAEATPSGSSRPPSAPGLGDISRGSAPGSSMEGRGGEKEAGAAAAKDAGSGNATANNAAGHASADVEPSAP
ncbi:GRF1-interacting factor [Asimina triloba]